MHKIKAEVVYEDFREDKEMFDFSNYSAKSKYCDDSNKLVVGKMKDVAVGVVMKEFVRLKPKMYYFLAEVVVSIKKSKSVNKNTVAAISHN